MPTMVNILTPKQVWLSGRALGSKSIDPGSNPESATSVSRRSAASRGFESRNVKFVFGKWHVLGSFWELHKWYIYEVGKVHRHDLETVLAGNSDSWKQQQAAGSSATVSESCP